MMDQSRNQTIFLSQIKLAFPIAIFFTFTFIFYGPLSIYLPNAEEIWFSLGTLLKVILPFSFLVLFVCTCFLTIIPRRISEFLCKLLFGISLAVYIQGNWMKNEYGSGVLDGSAIDWGEYTQYGVANTIVWILMIILPYVLVWIIMKLNIKASINTLIIGAALFLTAIQVPALISQLISFQPNENTDLKITTEGMYEVSEENNIIYVVLDAMDDDYFQEYIGSHAEYMEELNGFVHFPNTFASGSRTMIGIPSMFTGQPFTRQQTYTDYLNTVWGENNAFSALHDDGYKVKVYAGPLTYTNGVVDYIDNFIIDHGEVSSYKTLIKKIYKIDLFKFAPHVFKKRFWFNTSEFDSARDLKGNYKTNDSIFFNNFRAQGFSIDQSADKTFILYHLAGAHSPYIMGADTSAVNESTLEAQVEGCFEGLKWILQDLKDKGLYNQATIIVSADHGDKNHGEHPLLLIKEKNNTGKYKDSDVPASLFDIAPYLASLANSQLDQQIYGEDIFSLKEGQNRERHFFVNTNNNSRVVIEEYVAIGDVRQAENIRRAGEYQDPSGLETPYRLGTTLLFDRDATGNIYAVEGFATNTGFRTILRGPYVEMSIPIQDPPSDGDLNVKIKFHHISNSGLNYVLEACGIQIRESIIDDVTIQSGLSFSVPVEKLNEGNILTIKLHFTDIDEEEMSKSVQSRTGTVSLLEMVITHSD